MIPTFYQTVDHMHTMNYESPTYNFDPAQERQAYKILSTLAYLLAVVFAILGLLKVHSNLTHLLWWVFALVGLVAGTIFAAMVAKTTPK